MGAVQCSDDEFPCCWHSEAMWGCGADAAEPSPLPDEMPSRRRAAPSQERREWPCVMFSVREKITVDARLLKSSWWREKQYLTNPGRLKHLSTRLSFSGKGNPPLSGSIKVGQQMPRLVA